MANLQSRTLQKPLYARIITRLLAIILGVAAIASLVLAVYLLFNPGLIEVNEDSLLKLNAIHYAVGAFLASGLIALIAQGMWRFKNWARAFLLFGLIIYILYYFVTIIFAISSSIFAGESVVPMASILQVVGKGLFYFILNAIIPAGLIFILMKIDQFFEDSARQRDYVDKSLRYILMGTALSCIIIVFLIFLFTMTEAWDSIEEIGLKTMLLGTIWRPGSIIGTDQAQFGLLPMIAGSILSTFGAVIIGVPLSVGTAILLA